ncbi:MAG: 50S ribosomal protein L14 [Parachlamydiaceae bacterium]
MIQQETELEVADNSGAKLVKCIKVLGGTRRRYAQVGDIIVCSVRKVDTKGQVEKGKVVKAVVVRTRYYVTRSDGGRIRFESNSCVLLDDKGNPLGTRIFGPIPREIKDRGFAKIASMAYEVI